jgi:uncharacterized protein (DUF427 family)
MESVWDYPRPPVMVPCDRAVRIEHSGRVVGASDRAVRVLETASPPTVYVPREDLAEELLDRAEGGGTVCEWKGQARYHDVVADGRRAQRAAWEYPDPRPGFEILRGHLAFYPGRVACFLGDERVRPQEGGFYGGWITDDIRGPFKGAAGTLGW